MAASNNIKVSTLLQKPIGKKFWIWFIVIKILLFILIFGLFLLFLQQVKDKLL